MRIFTFILILCIGICSKDVFAKKAEFNNKLNKQKVITDKSIIKSGNLKGVVNFRSSKARLEKIDIPESYLRECGKVKWLVPYNVIKSSTLKDVVIGIEGIVKPVKKAQVKEALTITLQDCAFTKSSSHMTLGQMLIVENKSDLFLDLFLGYEGYENSTDYRYKARNYFIPKKDQKIATIVRGLAALKIKGRGDLDFIETDIMVFDNPYHTVSDDEGKFEIKKIPIGKYKMIVWHNNLGSMSIDIEIKHNELTEVELYYYRKGPLKKRTKIMLPED